MKNSENLDLDEQIKTCRALLEQKKRELAELVNLDGPDVVEQSNQGIDDTCCLENHLNDLLALRSQGRISSAEQAEAMMAITAEPML